MDVLENKSLNNDTIGLVVGATAGGLIITGSLVAFIPVIGTGVGATAITSGLAILGGGSLASGGAGMIGGLAVFGTITTVGTSVSAFVGNTIGGLIDEKQSIKNLRKNCPTITNNSDICDVDELLIRYNQFNTNTNILYNFETPILIHVNENHPFVGSTIILSPTKLIEMKKHKIISECDIDDIFTMLPVLEPLLYWDKIIIVTKKTEQKTFHIKHRNVLHKILEFINKFLIKKLNINN